MYGAIGKPSLLRVDLRALYYKNLTRKGSCENWLRGNWEPYAAHGDRDPQNSQMKL